MLLIGLIVKGSIIPQGSFQLPVASKRQKDCQYLWKMTLSGKYLYDYNFVILLIFNLERSLPVLDINPQGKKMILSIDGGGMRGMIAVAMLAELENLTGKTCPELFDMVAGTSAGAIIAAGIGLGMSAQEILVKIFRKRLPDAFSAQPRGLSLYLRYALGGFRNLYDLKPFVEALGEFGAGRKIADFQKPILFLTTKDLRTDNTYFVVSKGPGAAAFAEWPVVGSVGASGAAPIFFPPVLGNLIDGGVGAYGNPCLAATIEAMEYLGEAEGFMANNVIHLSVGTGFNSTSASDGAGAGYWLYNWVRYLILIGLQDSGFQQIMNTRAIYGTRVDFRRYNPLLTADSVGNILGVQLGGRPDPSKLDLNTFEREQVNLMEDIGRAYARKVDWTESGYLPWVDGGPEKGFPRDGGHALPGIKPVNWAGSGYE
jgi:hypothetical protein